MDFHEYARMLRRRWPIIVFAALLLAALAFATAPNASANRKTNKPHITYRATTVLIVGDRTRGVNMPRAALLATTGPVPTKVADFYGTTPGNGTVQRGQKRADRMVGIGSTTVIVSNDGAAGSMSIIATDAKEKRAKTVSDMIATGLIKALHDMAHADYNAQLADAQKQVDQAQALVNTAL